MNRWKPKGVFRSEMAHLLPYEVKWEIKCYEDNTAMYFLHVSNWMLFSPHSHENRLIKISDRNTPFGFHRFIYIYITQVDQFPWLDDTHTITQYLTIEYIIIYVYPIPINIIPILTGSDRHYRLLPDQLRLWFSEMSRERIHIHRRIMLMNPIIHCLPTSLTSWMHNRVLSTPGKIVWPTSGFRRLICPQ